MHIKQKAQLHFLVLLLLQEPEVISDLDLCSRSSKQHLLSDLLRLLAQFSSILLASLYSEQLKHTKEQEVCSQPSPLENPGHTNFQSILFLTLYSRVLQELKIHSCIKVRQTYKFLVRHKNPSPQGYTKEMFVSRHLANLYRNSLQQKQVKEEQSIYVVQRHSSSPMHSRQIHYSISSVLRRSIYLLPLLDLEQYSRSSAPQKSDQMENLKEVEQSLYVVNL